MLEILPSEIWIYYLLKYDDEILVQVATEKCHLRNLYKKSVPFGNDTHPNYLCHFRLKSKGLQFKLWKPLTSIPMNLSIIRYHSWVFSDTNPSKFFFICVFFLIINVIMGVRAYAPFAVTIRKK